MKILLFVVIVLLIFSFCIYLYIEKPIEKTNEVQEEGEYVGGEYGFYYDLDNPNKIYTKKHNETKFIEVDYGK